MKLKVKVKIYNSQRLLLVCFLFTINFHFHQKHWKYLTYQHQIHFYFHQKHQNVEKISNTKGSNSPANMTKSKEANMFKLFWHLKALKGLVSFYVNAKTNQ